MDKPNWTTLKGRVVAIMPLYTSPTGTFTKRELVVDVAGEGAKYPSPVPVTFKNSRVDLLDNVTEGAEVTVEAAIDGRHWADPKTGNDRYFVDIVGLRVECAGVAPVAKPAPATAAPSVLACSMETAVAEWRKLHGDDMEGFADFCRALKPGKPSKAYTAADWGDVLTAMAAAPAAADDVDLPF